MKHARLAACYAKDDCWLASDLSEEVQWGGNGVPTLFCTSNVTWRFRFFISISTCSVWSSI